MKYDVIIIGGGAAGIMAAISAKRNHSNLKIALLEKNEKLGKKILICGAGRCNVTNNNISVERFYGAPDKFISTVLNQFDNKDIMKFLNDLGIELYEEERNGRKKGKIFPITNQAATVAELLESELERLGIDIICQADVQDVIKTESGFTVEYKNVDKYSKLETHSLVIASGGKTYPQLGATGKGYEIAEKFGHSVIETVPSALPLEAEHWMITRLAGVRIIAEVTSIIDKQEIKKDVDEMMFASYGLTGPVILNVSREISVRINREKKDDCVLRINFFPEKKKEVVADMLYKRWDQKEDQKVFFSLCGLIPNKLAQVVLDYLRIDKDMINEKLERKDKKDIIDLLCSFEVKITGTRTWNEGEFTAGGINTKEIEPVSLESKIIKNLYFAGEIVNVDGDVGGFNLSWAWSSGYVVGKNIKIS